jgi:hypothetical protein
MQRKFERSFHVALSMGHRVFLSASLIRTADACRTCRSLRHAYGNRASRTPWDNRKPVAEDNRCNESWIRRIDCLPRHNQGCFFGWLLRQGACVFRPARSRFLGSEIIYEKLS